jgi:outer membrane receptor protein involved in Fe transport
VSPSKEATSQSSEPASDIVVTGTRVVRDGYEAPTPTTVLGSADIAARAPTHIADYLNQLPSLAGSTTPRTSIAALSTGAAGLNALNLRNLGVNRTLVLLDGQRVGASSLDGLVDINQFPTALVKRIDVVTGGASAGWGSDAVAGVVNFVLDKEFTGLKAEVQGGVTTYGDDKAYKVALTAGTSFLDDRAHFVISAEAAYNAGTDGLGSRKWYRATKFFNNPAYTATNGQPRLIVRPNAGFATATPGGIITSGPLSGIHFGEGGVPLQFNYGSIVSGMYMVGGDARYADWGDTGDLNPELGRQSVYARTSFDVSDHFELFAQLTYARATSHVAFGSQYNYGNITIRGDNAFIPATVAARVAALGITSFSLGSLNADLGPITFNSNRHSWRPVIGAKGDFNAFGTNWTWDAYAQRSVSRSYSEVNTTITPNYNAAIDSVRNANGQIVCRSTLTDPTNGCVPYNIFGTGVNNQAALNYVKGTAWLRSTIKQDVAAANLQGNPFSTWAGPVSVAVGFEHRRESVTGSNDPLSPARSYWAGNYNASRGSYHVTEGYLETVVPLAKDTSFAESLDLNGAIRATDYSTSGYVTTWKLGLTYSPIKDITIRATRSRDIRAPNMAELFQANQTATSTIMDPFNGNASVTAFQVTSGNLNLQPEKADSYGAGVVVQPQFLPGFAASVDYYSIDIKDALSNITAQVLVNQCFTGNTAFCGSITRNAAGAITTVNVRPVNLAKQIARGLDFEASYRRPIGEGNLTLRFLATRYIKNYFNNGINAPTDTVGTNYARGSAAGSLPKFSYNASVGWDQGKLGLLLTARGFSSGVYDTSYIECTANCPTSTTQNMTIDDNHLPGAIYFDANINYKFMERVEAFLSVDNVLNKDPGTVGWNSGGSPLDTNQTLYDTLGRRFRVGIRFKM